MKNKNFILIITIVLLLVACVLLLLVDAFGLNIIKHEETEISEFTVKYYGDFGSVNTVKIFDGSIRRGTFELLVDEAILESINENAPYLDDLNKDGHNDILIPHSTDMSGAVRYAAFIWDNDSKMFLQYDFLLDLANLTVDENGNIHSYLKTHNVIYPADKNVPEIYEEHSISTEYQLVEGSLCIAKNYTLIYYSETDAYCYVLTDYDVKTGEIISSVDDWMTSNDVAKLNLYY